MSVITGKAGQAPREGARRLLCVLATLGLVLCGVPAGEAQDRELTVVSWGGSYTRSQILGFVRAYEQATGVDVEMIDYEGGIDEIRSQVRSWNVKWDVVDLEMLSALDACEEGLLEPIDAAKLKPAPDGTPPQEDFLEGALIECGAGNVAASTIIAYDRTRISRPPASLADFFDVDEFPGQRGLRRTPQTNLEWALLADGVSPDRVYDALGTKEGLDRAFEVLGRIKPFVEWWRLGEDAVRLLETGQVVMTSAYNGRISAAAERGRPFAIVWDRQVTFMDVWGIPRNGERTDLAMDFVRFATATESLAAQASHIDYGPLRRSSLELLDEATRAKLPTAPENRKTAFRRDPAWWAEHMAELGPRFERWVERPVMVPRDWPAR
ncbi:MAG: ABC transporter substrate-binding protein [Gammaproteobacteria bacterium]